jgi:hypothetical protein
MISFKICQKHPSEEEQLSKSDKIPQQIEQSPSRPDSEVLTFSRGLNRNSPFDIITAGKVS